VDGIPEDIANQYPGASHLLSMHGVDELFAAITSCFLQGEATQRRDLELAYQGEFRGLVITAPLQFAQAQAKLWLAEESELFCNEQLCREAEQASLSQQHEHLCAMLAHAHCEFEQRQAILREEGHRFEYITDCVEWEVLNAQNVRYLGQLDKMLGHMLHALKSVERRQREATVLEQKMTLAELKRQQEVERRLVILKRRFPNAPEALGHETPMHICLSKFKFPEGVEDDMEDDLQMVDALQLPRSHPDHDLSVESCFSQCMTPEAGTPEPINMWLVSPPGSAF
jgi:hypothetical protein